MLSRVRIYGVMFRSDNHCKNSPFPYVVSAATDSGARPCHAAKRVSMSCAATDCQHTVSRPQADETTRAIPSPFVDTAYFPQLGLSRVGTTTNGAPTVVTQTSLAAKSNSVKQLWGELASTLRP